MQRVAITSASLGGYHSLSGATTYVYEPSPPYTLDVGKSFQMAFSVTGAPAEAQSWKVAGNVPPGLTVQGAEGEMQDENGVFNARVGTVTGTPNTPGTYIFTVQAYKLLNAQSPDDERLTDAPQEIAIEVVATELILPLAKISVADQNVKVSWAVGNGQVYQLQTASQAIDSWVPDDRPMENSGNQRSVLFSFEEFSNIRFIRIATRFP